MTTFQAPYQFRSLPDSQRNPYAAPLGRPDNQSNANHNGVKSPVSSSGSASTDDLLPDLWSEPAQPLGSGFSPLGADPAPVFGLGHQVHQNTQQSHVPMAPAGSNQPFGQAHYFYQTPRNWQEPPSFDPVAMGQTASAPRSHPLLASAAQTSMMRDVSLEYAQSLLPHSLLAPLTEENLDLNAQRSRSMPDELFSFEQHHESVETEQKQCCKARARSLESDMKKKAASSTSSVSSEHEHHHLHKSRHTSVSSTHSGSPKQKNINTQLYKTELCVSFMKMGVCPYGNKCQFAHGQDELKTVERPANWRSKPCANWAKFGSCRYGKRCCFKHGD